MQDLALVHCRADPRPVRVAKRLELLETCMLATCAASRWQCQEIFDHENSKVARVVPGCVVFNL